jgi:DNA repair protein RecN (Recombination protein N)
MIERFYAKNLIGFDTLDLELEPGLIVITGPSGAGKSVFMGSLLALFGLSNVKADISEVVLKKSLNLNLESFDNDEDEITIRAIKKEKIRYFLNDLTISKKRLSELVSPLVRHISQRSNNELSSELLLELLDAESAKNSEDYVKRVKNFKEMYDLYRRKLLRLQEMKADEKRVKELIEFAEFEIAKIDEISPKLGEDEELMAIKRKLSKREKISTAISKASRVFESEDDVLEVLSLIESDSSLFNEAMNMLRNEFERAEVMLEELDEIDVEEVLNRIEAIASLKRRYGSIEEALSYRDEKIKELEYYKNIDHELGGLEQEVEELFKKIEKEAKKISEARRKAAKGVEEFINNLLMDLRMGKISFTFSLKPLDKKGIDSVNIDLQGSTIATLSGGEFNRIRLALLLCKSELAGGEGILLIDEIDANVSGDESIAIAKLLKRLSKSYQIIAISHQPHLSASAVQHIVVTKESGKSVAKVLKSDERVTEISRMIAGENGIKEAKSFAKKIIEEFSN